MTKIAIAAGLLASMLFAVDANSQSVGIGAGQQGSQNYGASAAIGKFLSDELGLDVRVQSYGGVGQTLPLVDSGRLDLAVVPSPDFTAAALGQPPFDGHALKNLRMIAVLGPSYYGFMVRKDSEMTKVSDVKGKVITYGYATQPALRLQVEGILAAGGLSIDEMQLDNVPSVPNGVDDLIAGNTDVAFFAVQGGKAREAEAAVGIEWLALENTPENNAAMQKFVPSAYIATVAAGQAAGLDEPTPMMAYDYVFTAGTHVSDELVQKIVALLHEKPDQVRGINKVFMEFSADSMAKSIPGLSYHPAATAYYKSIGLSE